MAANSNESMLAVQSMVDLRASLRKLARARRAHKKQLSAVRLPGEVVQLKAVLIALICDDTELACSWAAQAQRFTFGRGVSQQASISSTIIREWMQRWSGHPEVLASLANLNHPWREAADRWLIESLAMDHIEKANASGITVPGTEVWAMLQRMWALRPVSASTKVWLAKLAGEAASRKSYLQKMRQRWNVHSSVLANRPGLSQPMLQTKVRSIKKLGLILGRSWAGMASKLEPCVPSCVSGTGARCVANVCSQAQFAWFFYGPGRCVSALGPVALAPHPSSQ